MTDEIMMTVAAAVAAKAAEALVSAGHNAVTRLVHLVRDRFTKDPNEAEVFQAAAAEPTDEERVRALGELLERDARADRAFADHLHSLWSEARPEVVADNGVVVNQITGNVGGHAVQARDIHGDVTFN